jgi:hypothetical protein
MALLVKSAVVSRRQGEVSATTREEEGEQP